MTTTTEFLDNTFIGFRNMRLKGKRGIGGCRKSLVFGVPLGLKVYYQCDTLNNLRVTLINLRAT